MMINSQVLLIFIQVNILLNFLITIILISATLFAFEVTVIDKTLTIWFTLVVFSYKAIQFAFKLCIFRILKTLFLDWTVFNSF